MTPCQFLTGDATETLQGFPDASVDLTVTSPPYDDVRTYTGTYSFDYPRLGPELLRVTKEGGVACVVIQDGTRDFAKSGTTARMQVTWMDLGWRLFECVVWEKFGTPGPWWRERFRVDHEYVCIFFKGEKPRYFDKRHLAVSAKTSGIARNVFSRKTDGGMRSSRRVCQPEERCRGTIWEVNGKYQGDTLKATHPATFPERLAADLIQCFSRPGDLILDPYSGSGTTCIEANRLGRLWLGIDIAPEYTRLAERRMWAATRQQALDFEEVAA